MIRGILLLVTIAVFHFGLSALTGQTPSMEGIILIVGGVLLIRTYELQDKIDLRKETFEEAWARMEAEGYIYGDDALEQVRFGWEMAHAN